MPSTSPNAFINGLNLDAIWGLVLTSPKITHYHLKQNKKLTLNAEMIGTRLTL